MQIIVFKELYVRGEWVLHQELVLNDANNTLWPILNSHGDMFRRRYTPLVAIAIDFHGSECPPKHINSTSLGAIRKRLGAIKFDTLFGSWPFDRVDLFQDAEAKNELANQCGITDCRIITWRL